MIPADHAPTTGEIQALAKLCSKWEYESVLLGSHRFLAAATSSIEETQRVATRLLGRTISLTKPALINPGDEQL